MRKSLFLLPLFSLTVAGLVACSNNENVAGGPGSITTNGIALVDGQPASYASVALRKVGYKAEKPVEENALVTADTYAEGRKGAVSWGEKVQISNQFVILIRDTAI